VTDYPSREDGVQKVTVTDQATGKVLADAVKLVRDNAGDVDEERKGFHLSVQPQGPACLRSVRVDPLMPYGMPCGVGA
jgi:hypothetical protein